MGYIKLASAAAAAHKTTGEAVIKVIKTARERAKFKKNPRKWLFENGYIFADEATGQPIGDGRIPAKFKLKIVEDKANLMHVRLPFGRDVPTDLVPTNENYVGEYPVFMARYFMRKCR